MVCLSIYSDLLLCPSVKFYNFVHISSFLDIWRLSLPLWTERWAGHRRGHTGLSPAEPLGREPGPKRHKTGSKTCRNHFTLSLWIRQQVDPHELSWAELKGLAGQEEGPPESEKPEFIIKGVRRREKPRCCRAGLELSRHTNVAKMPLSFCRADCGFEARTPELEPWFCCLLTVWPWAKYLAS